MIRRTIVALAVVLTACSGAQNGTSKPIKRNKIATAKKLLAQGIAAEKNGQITIAEKKYRRALQLRPSHRETVVRLTRFYIKQNRGAEAVKIAAAYYEKKMEDVTGLHLLADARIKAGDFRGAYDTLTELIDFNDNNAAAYEKRGQVQVLFGKYTKGIEDLKKAVQLDGDSVSYRVSLGSGLQQAQRLGEAQLALRGALQLNKKSPRAHLILGIVLRKNADIREALRHHLKAVRFAPKSSRAHFELGLTQNAFGDNTGSERSLSTAIKLNPRHANNWYAYGEISRHLKKWGQALNAYRQALKLDPKHPKAKSKLGVVLYYLNEFERAEAVLTEQIRKYPKRPYPYLNLGFVYAKQKKYGMAIGSLRRFIKLAPKGDGDIKTAIKKIKWIRKRM